MRNFIILALFACNISLYAVETVTVKTIGKAGKTFIINRGRSDGLKKNQIGYFFQIRNATKLSQNFLGKAEVIKVYNDASVWKFFKSVNPIAIRKRPQIGLIHSKEVLRGRRKYKINRRKLVKGRYEDLSDLKDGSKDTYVRDLQKRVDGYEGKDIKGEFDKVEDFEILEKAVITHSDEKYYREFDDIIYDAEIVELEKGPTRKEVAKLGRDEDFKRVVDQFRAKTTSTKFDVNETLKANRRVKTIFPDFETNRSSEFEAFRESESAKLARKNEVLEEIEDAGPDWSKRFDDRQLIKYVKEYGIQKEVGRQIWSTKQSVKNELSFNYILNFSDPAGATAENKAESPKRIQLALEYPLIKRSAALKDWSVEFAYEQGENNYDLGLNAVSEESSFKAMVHWYIVNNPTQLRSVITYVGGGLKMGSMIANFGTSDGEYNIVGLPILTAGIKYRPTETFGFKGIFNYESLSLSSKNDVTDTTLLEKNSVSLISFGVGISLYF